MVVGAKEGGNSNAGGSVSPGNGAARCSLQGPQPRAHRIHGRLPAAWLLSFERRCGCPLTHVPTRMLDYSRIEEEPGERARALGHDELVGQPIDMQRRYVVDALQQRRCCHLVARHKAGEEETKARTHGRAKHCRCRCAL